MLSITPTPTHRGIVRRRSSDHARRVVAGPLTQFLLLIAGGFALWSTLATRAFRTRTGLMSSTDLAPNRHTTEASRDHSSTVRPDTKSGTQSNYSLRRRINRMRSRFRHWSWRRRVNRQPVPPLNAWGYPDIGYW
jgi:hypothetical protein